MSRQCKGCPRKALTCLALCAWGARGGFSSYQLARRSLALIVFGKPPVAAGHSRPPRGPSVPRPRPRPRPEAPAAFPSTPSLRSRPAFRGLHVSRSPAQGAVGMRLVEVGPHAHMPTLPHSLPLPHAPPFSPLVLANALPNRGRGLPSHSTYLPSFPTAYSAQVGACGRGACASGPHPP